MGGFCYYWLFFLSMNAFAFSWLGKSITRKVFHNEGLEKCQEDSVNLQFPKSILVDLGRISHHDEIEAFLVVAATCGSRPAKRSLEMARKMKEEGKPIGHRYDDTACGKTIEEIMYQGYLAVINEVEAKWGPHYRDGCEERRIESEAISVSLEYRSKRRYPFQRYRHTAWNPDGNTNRGTISVRHSMFGLTVEFEDDGKSEALAHEIIAKSGVKEMLSKLNEAIGPYEEPEFVAQWREAVREGKRKRKFSIRVVECDCSAPKYCGFKHVYFVIKERGAEDKASGPPVFSQQAARAHLQGLQVSGYIAEPKVEELMRKVVRLGVTENFANIFTPPQPEMEARFCQEHMADDLRSIVK
jgi:hypothetical protein